MSRSRPVIVMCALCAAGAFSQPTTLRLEVRDWIRTYYNAKANQATADAELAALPATASPDEKTRATAAATRARRLKEAAWNTLSGKEQLAFSLGHLHTLKGAAVQRMAQKDRNLVEAFFSRRSRLAQGGESAASGGTTSLTALTQATEWVSAAFESGALAKESKGTVTTLRFAGYGIYSWLSQHERPCSISNPVCDTSQELLLRGLSGSISIDNSTPNQATTQPTQSNITPAPVLRFLNGGGKIASASARFQFLQRVKPATPAELAPWREALKKVEPAAADLTLATKKFDDKLNLVPKAFEEWQDMLVNHANVPTPEAFEVKYEEELKAFYARQTTALETLGDVENALQGFHKKLATELSAVLLKPAATFEYVYAAPSGTQSTSGLRFIGDLKLFKANAGGEGSDDVDKDYNGTFSYNASFNWYNEIPSGIQSGRMRDTQISAQLERAIGPATRKVRSSAAFSAYYQYQINPAILTFDQNAVTPGPAQIPIPNPAAAALDSKGHIGIVQGKLTLRLTDSISIPLAVSWANRTELIKASSVKGQFGLNIDLGSLMAKFKD